MDHPCGILVRTHMYLAGLSLNNASVGSWRPKTSNCAIFAFVCGPHNGDSTTSASACPAKRRAKPNLDPSCDRRAIHRLGCLGNAPACVCTLFRPFRLSCVAFAMLAVTPPETPDSREISTTAPAATVDDGPSILEVYNGSGGGQAVSTWIDRHRHKEGKVKDLLSSDDSEGRFLDAVKVGASIKRSQVGVGSCL